MNLNYKTNMNKLKFEKSSYLLQHADNPVNWYPWSDKADIDDYKDKIYKIEDFRDSIYFLDHTINSPAESINQKKCFNKFTAYICENNVCSEPIKDFNSLQKRLLNE